MDSDQHPSGKQKKSLPSLPNKAPRVSSESISAISSTIAAASPPSTKPSGLPKPPPLSGKTPYFDEDDLSHLNSSSGYEIKQSACERYKVAVVSRSLSTEKFANTQDKWYIQVTYVSTLTHDQQKDFLSNLEEQDCGNYKLGVYDNNDLTEVVTLSKRIKEQDPV